MLEVGIIRSVQFYCQENSKTFLAKMKYSIYTSLFKALGA
jgi:hypothetical protein